MKDASIKSEGFATSNSLKQLGEKIATNLQVVNFSNLESQVSKRLGVTIDWSNGKMILLGNN